MSVLKSKSNLLSNLFFDTKKIIFLQFSEIFGLQMRIHMQTVIFSTATTVGDSIRL